MMIFQLLNNTLDKNPSYPAAIESLKKNNQIESKNAEMKQAHGMEKAKYVGLLGMKTQTYLTTIVVNVKRMIRLMEIELA